MSDAALLVSLLLGLETEVSAGALSAQATKLFRAKQYEAACPLFQRVTELTPTGGSAFGDYGLCLARAGNRRSDAIAAFYRAIALSGSDAKLRKAVYHNLGQIVRHPLESHVPGPTEEGALAELEGKLPLCKIYEPARGCDRPVWACYSDGGNYARFGRDPKALAQKAWDPMLSTTEATSVIDGEILVVRDEDSESARSGWHTCYFEVVCQVVWADACAGRIGYSCNIAIGASRWASAETGGPDEVECTPTRTESGELKLR